MRPMDKLRSLEAFTGPEHQPFLWESGEQAALLVHGFPGTPAEFRPLAEALREQTVSVGAVLLPGFGPEIPSLHTRSHQEWIRAVELSYSTLKERCRQVTLIGNSMGGSLVLQVAANLPPARVIALAPFWQIASGWHRMLWPAIKLLFKEIKPYRKADFSDPDVVRDLNRVFNDVDFSDPVVQAALREIRMPVRVIDELQHLGKAAYRSAPQIVSSTLLIQGAQDHLVPPRMTRQLLSRLPGPKQYQEVVAGHDLLDANGPAWSEVKGAVLNFVLETTDSEAR